jgi:protease-4
MKKRTAWILVAGVAALAVGAAGVGALALLLTRGGAPLGGGEPFLYVDLGGEIPEPPPAELTPFERRPPTVRALVEAIDRAAGDPSIRSLVLRVSLLPEAGWARAQEIRDAISRFRKAGKPAYAHLELAGNKEYYLASACDKVFAVPTALLNVTGLVTEATFLRGTLDKLGVEAQFEGVGKYKNAPNQFTESGLTPPHREQLEALLDGLFGEYVEGLARARGKTRPEIERLLDGGPYDAAEAVAAGLVDRLLYQDELEGLTRARQGRTVVRYLKGARGFAFDGRPRVALVYVVGDIVGGRSMTSPFGGAFAGSDTIAAALRRAREDDSVRAVLLRVDSPGGSGTASEVIWREVQLVRKKKPVVVSMGDVAASGGYYVAMGADAIVAQPSTITGSIGVFAGKFSLRGLYDKLGIGKVLLSRGRHAEILSDYRPWNEEERARVRALMVAFYHQFVTKAAEGRHKSYAEVHELAQGRVWTGVQARQGGLVDRLGGFETALDLVREKAGIPKGQAVSLVVLPEPKGFFETLMERQEESLEARLPADARATLSWISRLAEGQLVARLPFELRAR